MATHYRIVRAPAGYDVEAWVWWFPLWTRVNHANSFATVEEAEKCAIRDAKDKTGEVVKKLGPIPRQGECQ